MKFSICIVNYKTKDVTLKSIQTIYDHYKLRDFEIILVDNTPGGDITEEDIKEYPEIKLYPNISNSYFSGGYNRAMQLAQGEYCLVMSSDIRLIDDSISKLYNFLTSRPDVGAVEATLLNTRNNEVTRTSSKELTPFRDLVRSKKVAKFLFPFVYKDYSYGNWDRMDNREVEVITNAFMMIRRDLFLKIGGLEEAMKLYFTEERMSDLIRARGLKLFHYGEARVEHFESASTGSCPSKWIKSIYKTDRKLYFLLKKQDRIKV